MALKPDKSDETRNVKHETGVLYAVIDIGGKQYRVEKGDDVIVDRLDLAEGKTMSLKPVLLGGGKSAVTAAELKGARVKARVEEHLLGKKIRVFKYKPKTTYKRTRGHRSRLSRITIQSIAAAAPKKKAEPKAEVEKPAKLEKPAKA